MSRAWLRGVAPLTSLAALALTVFSYAILTSYDRLALRDLGKALPYRQTALASFLGFAFSHADGASAPAHSGTFVSDAVAQLLDLGQHVVAAVVAGGEVAQIYG